MEFLRYLYDIIAFVVLSMGCISMYEHIKKWASREDSEGKVLISTSNKEYFLLFVAMVLFFLFVFLLGRMGITTE